MAMAQGNFIDFATKASDSVLNLIHFVCSADRTTTDFQTLVAMDFDTNAIHFDTLSHRF